MAERIILRAGEAVVEGGPPGAAAEPEVAIGALDGPVGMAMAKAVRKAMRGEASIAWLLDNQNKVVHKFYLMGLDKKI